MVIRDDVSTSADQKTLKPLLSDNLTRRLWPLDSGKLCDEARCRTRLEDFGDPDIESRLSILVNSMEKEANLHSMGRFLARMHLRRLLETRLLLTELWRKSGDLNEERIQNPIFITGMPRSGSTFLHELFVQDEANRAPLVWEVMFPLRRAGAGTHETNRHIRQAARCLWWFRRIAPRADEVHPMRATTPHECVAIHSYAFLSQEFTTTFRIPTYESFLNSVHLSPAYAWEKSFLQHLKLRGPAKRWVLKAPDHVFSLDALFKIFPDAVIIQMHRNPFEVLKSSSQLMDVLRRMFARPEASNAIIMREAQVLADGMDRITRFRDLHPELSGRFLDVHYHQLVSEPLGTLRRLYWQLDLPLTDATLERVRMLTSTRTRYARHRPAFAQPVSDFPGVARSFERYCLRFGINQLDTKAAG